MSHRPLHSASPTSTYTGSCLCASITITAHGPPDRVVTCSCEDCRKNAGGPLQIYDRSNVSVSDPHDRQRTYTVTQTQSGSPKHKAFCSACGCTLWTQPMRDGGEKLVVRTAMLGKGFYELRPTVELFTGERPDWAEGVEGAEKFETRPGQS